MDTVAPNPNRDNRKIRWRSDPAIKQVFPFPYTMICYMTMNPSSSKAYNKMIKIRKYFFEANPILVVEHMYDYENCGRTRIFSKASHNYHVFNCSCCFRVDFRKISSKIWLKNRLIISGKNVSPFSSLLCDKLYRCEITELNLFDTNILLNDFKILAQSVEKLELISNIKVCYPDGRIASLDKILELCPKIQNFRYDFYFSTIYSIISSSTLKNISKLQNLSNLKKFELENVPEIFDIQDVSDFVTKNFMDTEIHINLSRFASAEYEAQLVTIYDKIQELQIQNHFIL